MKYPQLELTRVTFGDSGLGEYFLDPLGWLSGASLGSQCPAWHDGLLPAAFSDAASHSSAGHGDGDDDRILPLHLHHTGKVSCFACLVFLPTPPGFAPHQVLADPIDPGQEGPMVGWLSQLGLSQLGHCIWRNWTTGRSNQACWSTMWTCRSITGKTAQMDGKASWLWHLLADGYLPS